MQFIKYSLLILVILAASCKKDKPEEKDLPTNLENGILVLNEGLFQLNNSSLSWIDLTNLTVDNSFFEKKTGRNLGDTGNDLKRYGNKIYVLVNVSSTMEVLDALTGDPIKQISFINGNTSKQPRSMAFFGSKIFVSCFDGFVDVIDTNNLQIEKRIPVGLNPDQIMATDAKIIVSNSGGLNSPVMDSTISIINPVELVEEQKVFVGKNPGNLQFVGGFLYVHQRGNYGTIPSVLKQINLQNYEIEQSFSFVAHLMEKMDENLLIVYEENSLQKLGIFNPISNVWINTNLIEISGIETLYDIIYDAKKQEIYLLDAHGYTVSGEILKYSKSGSFLQKFKVGLNPTEIVIF